MHNTLKSFILIFVLLPHPAFSETTKTVTVPVVRDHAGGDEEHSNTFVYTAPNNFTIQSFTPTEISRFGDATYTPRLINPTRLEIAWRTKSRTTRVLGAVVDTDTAELKLDVQIVLVMNTPLKSVSTPPPVKQTSSPPTQASDSSINELIIGIAVTVIAGILLIIITPFVRRKFHPEPPKEEEKLVNTNWFDSSAFIQGLKEEGYTFYWSNADKVEELRNKGYEIIYEADTENNKKHRLVNKSNQVLLGKNT